MLKWVQSGLSAVAGTAEPEYGPEAIHPITQDIAPGSQVFRATTLEDFAWQLPPYTNVETTTFYFNMPATGHLGFAQIIHSNIIGVHTTAQFTFKWFHKDSPTDFVWTSTKLEDFVIKGTNFYAKDLLLELVDNQEYRMKASVTPELVVDLTFSRDTPGVVFGLNGTTYYGTDKAEPWGSMRHAFWPRCTVTGLVKLGEEDHTVSGLGMYVMALQGMKPHHAAALWNFLNFQSEHFLVVLMEFTTPKLYAKTRVLLGIVVKDNRIVAASVDNTVTHLDTTSDDYGWPVPGTIKFEFDGVDAEADLAAITDGLAPKVHTEVTGLLKQLVERVDVMAEIPQFVKAIVSGVAGIKPCIYQFCNAMDVTVTEKGELVTELGVGYSEATFISD